MRTSNLVSALALALAVVPLARAEPAPLPTADALLEKVLKHHDPDDTWSSRLIEISARVRLTERLATERGYAERTERIRIDNSSGRFHYSADRGPDRIEIEGSGDELIARLNGTSDISAEDRKTYRLEPDQLSGWRDYFIYMYGLPMKLRDPGTRMDPAVERAEFAGREVLSLRVTYDPEVGGDVWYFYVDPVTFALVGCRFFHVESDNDGEYLVFEGEVEGLGHRRGNVRYIA